MKEQKNSERPEVFALRKDGADWQFSRRDFLKAVGIGAAVMGTGIGKAKSEADITGSRPGLANVCRSAPVHKDRIRKILISPDDKYMITCSYDPNPYSGSSDDMIKCWDLENGCELTGWVSHEVFSVRRDMVITEINGKNCLVGDDWKTSQMKYYELPISDQPEKKDFPFTERFEAMTADAAGNLYIANLGKILFYSADSSYEEKEIVYEVDTETHFRTLHLLSGGSQLFIHFEDNTYGILELTDRKLRMLDWMGSLYSFHPEEEFGLFYDDKNNTVTYVDLNSGNTVWRIDIGKTDFSRTDGTAIRGMIVSKDGEKGFLFGPYGWIASALVMISMKDGSILDSTPLCSIPSEQAPMALTGDGKKIMVGVDSSVFIISLPDLRNITLPADFESFTEKNEGSLVKMTDTESGTVYTFMLEQDAEIPDGAVCVCNTVTGTGPQCRSQGFICKCDGHYHYWHPN